MGEPAKAHPFFCANKYIIPKNKGNKIEVDQTNSILLIFIKKITK